LIGRTLAVVLACASPTLPAVAACEGGQAVFEKCAVCHVAARGATPTVGPNLWGIGGRRAASLPGFQYSAAMLAVDWTWTEARLDTFLTNPQQTVPGTAMAYEGVRRATARAALICYLGTLHD
jgi:cytochrome c